MYYVYLAVDIIPSFFITFFSILEVSRSSSIIFNILSTSVYSLLSIAFSKVSKSTVHKDVSYKLKNIDNITEELSEEPTISKSYLYKFSSVRKFIYSCLTTTGSLIAMAIIFGVVILVFWITKLGFEDGLTILDLILLLLIALIE